MANELVLVTGATGFIGSHTIIQLLEKGYRVRGTIRDGSRAEKIKSLILKYAPEGAELELVEANLSDDGGWDAAASGCTFVHHIASPIPIDQPKDPQELIRPAREGALRVLKAAKAAGCQRVVMTSSLAAIAYGHEKEQARPYNEEDWTNLDYPRLTPYVQSKTLAEKAAWDYVNGEGAGLELATVNPGLVLGPVLEKDIGTSAEAVKQLMSGEIPLYPRIGFSVVDVRDVADCHIRAMTTPEAAGKRFACAGEYAWLEDIGAILRAQYRDRRIPKRRMPNWVMRIAANFNGALKQTLDDLDRTQIITHARATELLGWKPRSVKEATIATADSLIELGIV